MFSLNQINRRRHFEIVESGWEHSPTNRRDDGGQTDSQWGPITISNSGASPHRSQVTTVKRECFLSSHTLCIFQVSRKVVFSRKSPCCRCLSHELRLDHWQIYESVTACFLWHPLSKLIESLSCWKIWIFYSQLQKTDPGLDGSPCKCTPADINIVCAWFIFIFSL